MKAVVISGFRLPLPERQAGKSVRMVRDPLKTTASERQRAVQEAIRKLTALDVPDDGTSNEPSRKVAKPARRVAEKPRRERPKH